MAGVFRCAAFAILTALALGVIDAATNPSAARAGAEVLQSTRVTVDQPDEQDGPQIHFVYAVPAGGIDRSFDVDGTLDRWAANFNDWLAAQTGGVRLRLDTFGGVLDGLVGDADADRRCRLSLPALGQRPMPAARRLHPRRQCARGRWRGLRPRSVLAGQDQRPRQRPDPEHPAHVHEGELPIPDAVQHPHLDRRRRRSRCTFHRLGGGLPWEAHAL
jgi:hypothetical protein